MKCEGARIHVLDENFVDVLLPSKPNLFRYNMDTQFVARSEQDKILAENGLCFFIETFSQGRVTRTLFDSGLTSGVVLHNARAMGVDLNTLDQIVLSHGHPDHVGGIAGVLAALDTPVPVYVHPDAFRPRSIVKPYVTLSYINAGFTREAISENGGLLMQATDPVDLGPGLRTSGQMEVTVDFEREAPVGRVCICDDGAVEADEIRDHQVLGIDIEDVGLLVIDPCGHAGVISAVNHMRDLSGGSRLSALFGGFHTGHPGISASRIDGTADALIDLEPDLVAPMHCSGFPMKAAVHSKLPDAFEIFTAGSVIDFGQVPPR